MICRESDAMKAVVVMSYSVCHVVYNGYDIVNYSGCDIRNTFGVISTIQWIRRHRYSGQDVKYNGCDDIKTLV